jgi:hypothetical protein
MIGILLIGDQTSHREPCWRLRLCARQLGTSSLINGAMIDQDFDLDHDHDHSVPDQNTSVDPL